MTQDLFGQWKWILVIKRWLDKYEKVLSEHNDTRVYRKLSLVILNVLTAMYDMQALNTWIKCYENIWRSPVELRYVLILLRGWVRGKGIYEGMKTWQSFLFEFQSKGVLVVRGVKTRCRLMRVGERRSHHIFV